MNRLRRFMINGILMAIVTIAMRSVAVAFNVYISNKIGAVAMGLFTLISTVYGFGITFATSGINLATTRLLAQAMGDTSADGTSSVPEDRQSKVSCILGRCIAYSLFFGAAATVILWFSAEPIGIRILGDERTVASLKVLSVTFIPIAVSSVLCGYFSEFPNCQKKTYSSRRFSSRMSTFFCTEFFDLSPSTCVPLVPGHTPRSHR